MATPPDLPVHRFPGADGLPLAFRETGDGPPVVLIHGLFSNGWTNWVRYGHAAHVAAAGFRVVMPDLRGHGASAAPHDAAAYPPDILAADGEALLAHLGIAGCPIGGYSLGGRTVARMLVRGARPSRAIVAGMGADGMLDVHRRARFFREMLLGFGSHARGTPAWAAEAFLKTTGVDRHAMLPLLDSFVDTDPAYLAGVPVPTLVLSGVDDQDNGSPAALAGMLPRGTLATVPGNHMTAVLGPALGVAIAQFLAS